MSQYWMIDPATGDYEQEGGSPVNTDSLVVPAYYRLKIKAETWLYAPDPGYGSTFHKIKKRKTNGDTSSIENAAGVALQPIVDDGRAVSIDIDTIFAARNNVGLDTKINKQRGVFDQLKIPSLGI